MAAAKPIIVITGSTGLIGTRVQQALAPEYQVVGLDVKAPKSPIAGTDFIECDLTKDSSVREALAEIRQRHGDKIASVLHLAAYYDFSGEPSPLYDELTVEGTRRLVRELQAFEVEQFVFSSSLLVMEPTEDEREKLDEASPTRAEWAYPESKLKTEQLLKQERGKLPVVILRIAGVYDEQGNSLPIGQHIKRIFEKQLESYMFPGDKDHGQALVHLDDLVDCFKRVVKLRGQLAPFELFLIAEPDMMSHEELQEELGELIHGHEWPTIRIPKSVAKTGARAKAKMSKEELFIQPWMIDLADDNYRVDISKAHERLGWRPKYRLRETLEPIIAGLKRDPRAWYEQNKLPLPKDESKLEPVAQ